MKYKIFLSIAACMMLLTACGQQGAVGPTEFNVMTHDSFSASEAVIRDFEQEYQVKINFISSGDTGSALNQAILTKSSPLADVFYGVDNTFLSRALQEDIFEAYESPLLPEIADEFKLDKEWRALPVDYGDVCINYDKAYFVEKSLTPPESLDDLLAPEYHGLLVVENPATSSPGLAFLLATITYYGESGYLEYWQRLKDNGVVVVNDWETAYYTNFSASSGKGAQPLVVSYATSPAAEVVFADPPVSESPTASVVGSGTCFRQIEFVGILKGTRQRELAEAFVDFMLSRQFQEDIPLNMFVFPVNSQAQLPEVFQTQIQIPIQPAYLPMDLIASQRESWIEAWRQLMLG